MNCQLLYDRLALIEDIGPEIELLFHQSVILMCPVEVLSQLADGNIQIKI